MVAERAISARTVSIVSDQTAGQFIVVTVQAVDQLAAVAEGSSRDAWNLAVPSGYRAKLERPLSGRSGLHFLSDDSRDEGLRLVPSVMAWLIHLPAPSTPSRAF